MTAELNSAYKVQAGCFVEIMSLWIDWSLRSIGKLIFVFHLYQIYTQKCYLTYMLGEDSVGNYRGDPTGLHLLEKIVL